jgi:hypothetical protein
VYAQLIHILLSVCITYSRLDSYYRKHDRDDQAAAGRIRLSQGDQVRREETRHSGIYLSSVLSSCLSFFLSQHMHAYSAQLLKLTSFMSCCTLADIGSSIFASIFLAKKQRISTSDQRRTAVFVAVLVCPSAQFVSVTYSAYLPEYQSK